MSGQLPLLGMSVVAISTLAIIGNTLIFLATYRYRNLRTVPNLIILNLSLADILFSAIIVPINGFLSVNGGVKSWKEIICQIAGVGTVLFCITSISTLAFVSVERYMATKHPIRHRNIFGTKLVKYTLMSIWLWSSFLSLLPFVTSKYAYMKNFFHCSVDWADNLPTTSVYVVLILLPLIILAYCNICILQTTRNRPRVGDIQSPSSQLHERIRIQRERRISVLMILLVGACFMCWTPYCVAMIFLASGEFVPPKEFMMVAVELPALNCVCNPIIYGVMNRNFRKALRNTLCCK